MEAFIRMMAKLVAFLCLLVVLIDRSHALADTKPAHGVCANATDAAKCMATAERCMIPRKPGPMVAFCQCLERVQGVKEHFIAWAHAEHGDENICKEDHSAESMKHTGPTPNMPFAAYLKNKDSAKSAELDCCIAKGRGFFDNNGVIIVAAWKPDASGVTDAKALAAVNSGVDNCVKTLPAGSKCDVNGFMQCVLKECYQTLSA